MNNVAAVWIAVVIAILSQLLITVPLVFTLVRTWVQSKINVLQMSNQARHDETATKLDTLVSSLTQNNGSGSGTR